ncbi:MAG: FtsX-like permease family protein [Candidatus Limnocylindrales bacterium]
MPGRSALPTLGLARMVVRRARADLPFVLAVWLLLTSAVTLIAASVLYGDTVALGGIRRSIASAPGADHGIAIGTTTTAAALGGFDATIRDRLATALTPAHGEIVLVVRSASLAPIATAGAPAVTGGGTVAPLTVLAGFEGLASHATLTSGTWPQPGSQPVQATVSQGAAAALGLHVGDQVRLADASTPGADPTKAVAEVAITGIWTTDPTDGYWLGDPFDTTGVGQGVLRGPLFVAPADLLGRGAAGGALAVEWRTIPDPTTILPGDLAAIEARLAGLPAAVRAIVPFNQPVRVSGGLATVLDGVAAAGLVNGSNVTLLTIQFAVLAAYAVLLVGAMLGDRRRAHVGLIRSRGASPVHVAGLAVGEALLVAVPATLVALPASVAVVWAVGQLGPLAAAGVATSVHLDSATVVAAIAAGLVGVIVLALPVATTGANLGGIRAAMARPMSRTLAQRLGLDVALVAVAIVAIWQLQTYGATLTRDLQGSLGIDPLLVAAPALGLLAGAVLTTRLMPRLAELGERWLGRARGLVGALGARQLARRPLRYTRAALLLVLAAAMVTFAGVYATTWAQSQVDQAGYKAASDVRLVSAQATQIPSWGMGPALRALPGVTSAMPVVRQTFQLGNDTIRDGNLLALDPSLTAALVALPRGTPTGLSAALAGLATARPASHAVALPGRPKRLVLSVDKDLTPPDGEDITGAQPLGLVAFLQDADGRIFRMSGGAIGYDSGTQVVAFDLTEAVAGLDVEPVYPLGLLAVELRGPRPDVTGTERLSSVAVDAGAGGPSSTVELLPEAGLVQIDPATDTAIGLWSAPPPRLGGVAAIVSQAFLDQTGTRVGDEVSIATSAGAIVRIDVVAVSPLFPTLDPGVPFLIVDDATLDLDRLSSLDDVAPTTEWWLGVTPAQVPTVMAAATRPPFNATAVIGRAPLIQTLENDPVALSTVGAFTLGAIAALAFAAIGFLVTVLVSTSERTGEFALLHALGLSRAQLRRWLSLEDAFLLVVGIVGGIGLGLLVAWLVLPFTTLAANGSVPVPRPAIVVPVAILAVLVALAVALLVMTVVIISRQIPRIRVANVLRAGE